MKLVTPNGAAPARVMLVGDYPTEAEVSLGSSYAGSSFITMERILRTAGLDPNAVWRTHYYKIPVTGYGSDDHNKRNDALVKIEQHADWTAMLRAEIEAVKPNIILASGELAMRALTGQTNLMKRAGSIYPLAPRFGISRPIRVSCIHSTRSLWTKPEEYFLMRMDIQKVLPFIEALPPFREDYELVIGDKPTYVRDWLNTYNRKPEFGVFDVETHNNLITCLCFCFDGKHSMSVPLLDQRLSPTELGYIWYYVYQTLVGHTPWVNQNIKYDLARLEAMRFRVRTVLGDTMLRASLIDPELPKGLDFLTRKYTNIGYYKDEGKEYNPREHDFKRMLLYNAKDGIATHRVYVAQEHDIKALNLGQMDARIKEAFFIYKRMEDVGVRIDLKRREELIAYYEREILLMEAELDALAGRRMNAKSGDQLGPLLIELGANTKIRIWDEDKGKFKYKTGKVEMEDLYVNVSDNPTLEYICRLALAIRKLYKLKQFCEFIPQKEFEYWVGRTSWKLHGTETGRSATSRLLESIYYSFDGAKPEWEQPGFAMQQQPKHPWEYAGRFYGKEFRSIFIPRDGYAFVEFDLSQAEARVVDVLAEDYESLEEYGKVDKHCKTAAIVNKLDYNELYRRHKAEDQWATTERQKGKSYRHGFNYDETAYNLSRRTHIPFKEVDAALQSLREASPRIRNIFHATVKSALATSRTLITPFGRVRRFFSNAGPKQDKEGYAHIPQSTIPDHLRFNIFFPLQRHFGSSVNFLVEWHDSLLAEVPIKRLEEYRDLAKQFAKTPIKFNSGTFIRKYDLVIPIDLAIGYENWKDMKKF